MRRMKASDIDYYQNMVVWGVCFIMLVLSIVKFFTLHDTVLFLR